MKANDQGMTLINRADRFDDVLSLGPPDFWFDIMRLISDLEKDMFGIGRLITLRDLFPQPNNSLRICRAVGLAVKLGVVKINNGIQTILSGPFDEIVGHLKAVSVLPFVWRVNAGPCAETDRNSNCLEAGFGNIRQHFFVLRRFGHLCKIGVMFFPASHPEIIEIGQIHPDSHSAGAASCIGLPGSADECEKNDHGKKQNSMHCYLLVSRGLCPKPILTKQLSLFTYLNVNF